MKKLLVLILATAGCAGPRPAPVLEEIRQEPAPRQSQETLRGLTLDRAFAVAERLHPDLAEGRARIEAAFGREDQAGIFPNPELIVRAESAPDDADVLAGMGFRLPIFGRLGAASRAAERERERVGHEFEIRRREVRSRVHAAFATALYAREVEKLQAALLKAAEDAASVSRARVDAGDALPEELDRAEMEVLRTRLDHEQAKELLDLASLDLAGAMGDASLRIESVDGDLDAELAIPTLEAVLASAGEGPFVAAALKEVDVQRGRLDLAEIERIPDLNLELLYRRNGAEDENEFDAGLSLDLPLWDRNQGRIREARADIEAAEARLRGTRSEVVRRVRETYTRLVRALARARLLEKEMVPRAETVLRSAEARYGAGDVGLSEVLPIRRDRAAAKLAHLQSLREVLEAWAALRAYLRTP